MNKLNFVFLICILFFLCFNFSFAQDLDGGQEEGVASLAPLDPPSEFAATSESETSEEETTVGEFKEEGEYAAALLVGVPIPKFSFSDKNRDPFISQSFNSTKPSLDGTKVPSPVYLQKKDKEGNVIADVNRTFGFAREYGLSTTAQFVTLKWLTFGLSLSFSYQSLPFICNLPDPKEASEALTPEELETLKRYPTYYGVTVLDENDNIVGQLTSSDFTDSFGNKFSSSNLSYGIFRVEISPSALFFPLQNAGKDLKGLYFGVAPMIGLTIDSPDKIYLDTLYEANMLRSVTSYYGSRNYASALRNAFHEPANWNYIRQKIDNSLGDEMDFITFYGGARLDIGWQGVFESGLVLDASGGIGIDSSRGFYLQLKAEIGYLFRR